MYLAYLYKKVQESVIKDLMTKVDSNKDKYSLPIEVGKYLRFLVKVPPSPDKFGTGIYFIKYVAEKYVQLAKCNRAGEILPKLVPGILRIKELGELANKQEVEEFIPPK
jgi:hypothetical protein